MHKMSLLLPATILFLGCTEKNSETSNNTIPFSGAYVAQYCDEQALNDNEKVSFIVNENSELIAAGLASDPKMKISLYKKTDHMVTSKCGRHREHNKKLKAEATG